MRIRIGIVAGLVLVLLLLLSSPAWAIDRWWGGYVMPASIGGLGTKADIAWGISDPAWLDFNACWVSTPAYFDPALGKKAWFIQAGVRGDNGQPWFEDPYSYVEWHDSGGGYHRINYSDQPIYYYRNYEVRSVAYRQWQAYIQGAYRATGYTIYSQDESQALTEITDQDNEGLFYVRNVKFQRYDGWYHFNSNAVLVKTSSVFSIVFQNGHYYDWNVYF